MWHVDETIRVSLFPSPFLFAIGLSLTEQQNLLSCHRDPVDLVLQSVSITISQQGEQMGLGRTIIQPHTGGGREPKQSRRGMKRVVFLRNDHSGRKTGDVK